MPSCLRVAVAAVALAACQRQPERRQEDVPAAAPRPDPAPVAPAAPSVAPPLPVASPPADAEVLTGIAPDPKAIVYVKRLTPGTGERPGRNDTVAINMNGWRVTGETFLSTRTRRRPVQQSLAMLAPGFSAAVQSMRPGERAMIWVPPTLGSLGEPMAKPETTVYEVELVSFEASPPTPPDVAAPPSDAERRPSGLITRVVKPGTGTTRPHYYDGVVFHYSAWDATGRMFDSSELRKRPQQTFGFREWAGIEEALTLMVVGERRRVWIPPALADTSLPGLPPGVLCYELELLEIAPMKAPPPVPDDLLKRPADATITPGGVAYRVLTPGTGTVRPAPSDRVKVHFSGWRLDGRLFDSSVVIGAPAEYIVGKLIPGWVDVLQQMTAGQKVRMWIPSELAFRGEPGRPSGTLVFDLELIEIVPPAPPKETAPAQLVAPPKQPPQPPVPAP